MGPRPARCFALPRCGASPATSSAQRATCAEHYKCVLPILRSSILGVALLEKGSTDEGARLFDDAIQFSPKYPEAARQSRLDFVAKRSVGRGMDRVRVAVELSGRRAGWQCVSPAAVEWRTTHGKIDPCLWRARDCRRADVRLMLSRSDRASCQVRHRLRPAARNALSSLPSKGRRVRGLRGREDRWRLPQGMNAEVQIAAGSVPLHLRPTVDHFPSRPSYLAADPKATAAAKNWLARLGDGLKIGISLGGASNNWGAERYKLSRQVLARCSNWRCEMHPFTRWLGLQRDGVARATMAFHSTNCLERRPLATSTQWPRPLRPWMSSSRMVASPLIWPACSACPP